jgi:hypothetical protein
MLGDYLELEMNYMNYNKTIDLVDVIWKYICKLVEFRGMIFDNDLNKISEERSVPIKKINKKHKESNELRANSAKRVEFVQLILLKMDGLNDERIEGILKVRYTRWECMS